MECQNGDETAWTHQIWHSEIVKVTLLSIVTLHLFSQPNMKVRIISTMDQRWINDVSLAPPLPTLAAPDDSLLELAPPPLRKERQSQTNRNRWTKKNHRNKEIKVKHFLFEKHLFLEKIKNLHFAAQWHLNCNSVNPPAKFRGSAKKK